MTNSSKRVTDRGVLWLPSRPDNRVVAEVCYSPIHGFKIRSVGSLLEPNERIGNRPQEPIFGQFLNGKCFTLFDPYFSNVRTRFPGVPSSKFGASRGVVGGHYKTPSDIKVHAVQVSFDHLTEWAGISSLNQKYDVPSRTISLDIRSPDSINLGKINDLVVKLVGGVLTSHRRRKYVVKQECLLRLESPQPIPFKEFEKAIRIFQRFLTFGVGESCRQLRVEGETPDKISENEGETSWREVSMIQRLSSREKRPEIAPQKMFFSIADVLPDPSKVFTAFVKFLETFRTSLRFILSSVFLSRFATSSGIS
jgi:hypothetical protein